jgi:hypothetical protein
MALRYSWLLASGGEAPLPYSTSQRLVPVVPNRQLRPLLLHAVLFCLLELSAANAGRRLQQGGAGGGGGGGSWACSPGPPVLLFKTINSMSSNSSARWLGKSLEQAAVGQRREPCGWMNHSASHQVLTTHKQTQYLPHTSYVARLQLTGSHTSRHVT